MYDLLRWVNTCNVTAYPNAVTMQVTDMIRSYELNLHPVLHGVTVSCERYTLGFPVCYGSPSDVFAASSGRWWRVTLHIHTCSGRNRIIPLIATAKYRQHTEQARNVTAYPNFDTLRGHKSRPHCHDTVLRYAVTSQMCTYLYTSMQPALHLF